MNSGWLGMCEMATIKGWNKKLRSKQECKASTTPKSVLAARLSKPSQVSANRMKERSHRVIFYAITPGGITTTYLTTFVYRLVDRAPFDIILLATFFFP